MTALLPVAALVIGCAPAAAPSRPATGWTALPAFVEPLDGRPFRFVLEGRVPIPIRYVHVTVDGARLWAIEGDVTERIEKPTQLGEGEHEMGLVVKMVGTGALDGYTLELKSAHVVSSSGAGATAVLYWDPNGAAFQDHPKVRWRDDP